MNVIFAIYQYSMTCIGTQVQKNIYDDNKIVKKICIPKAVNLTLFER